MGIGVIDTLNATAPTDYPSSHPLSKTSHYWTPWSSYIHSKLEGNIDTLGNGFDLSFLYHTGTDELYRTIDMSVDININDKKNEIVEIDIDHLALLKDSQGNVFNIKAKPKNHKPDDIGIIGQIMDNFSEAMKMNIE